MVVFLRRVELFHLQLGCSKEEGCHHCVRSIAKTEWKLWHLGKRLWDSGDRLRVANCCQPRKGYCCPPQDVLQALTGEGWSLFTFSKEATRKKVVLVVWEASPKSGVRTVAFVNRLWLAYPDPAHKGHHNLPHKGHLHPPSQRYYSDMLRTVQFVNRLGHLTNGLFVNGFILATVPTVMFIPCSSPGMFMTWLLVVYFLNHFPWILLSV